MTETEKVIIIIGGKIERVIFDVCDGQTGLTADENHLTDISEIY